MTLSTRPVASASLVAAASTLARRAVGSTPARLRVAVGAVWLASLAFLLAGLSGMDRQRDGLRTVGRDAAPSVIAAQQVKAELAAMHAVAARELLAPSGVPAADAGQFDQRRREVVKNLMTAAGNITYGDAERVPIRTMLEGLGPYEGAIAQARLLRDRGDPGFVDPLRRGDALLTDALLPAADALDRANREALDVGYAQARSSAWWGMARLFLGGLLALGALVGAQAYLTRRTHRRVNPALVGATATTLVLLIALALVDAEAGDRLRRAKEDCFESIHVLEQAHADAFEALAAARLALLDPARSPDYLERYRDRRDRIIAPAPGSTLAGLVDAVEAQSLGVRSGGDDEAIPRAWGALARADLPGAVQGHLATELRNITFVGEREAAVATLREFVGFVAAASRAERLAGGGKTPEAVELATSARPDGMEGSSRAFDSAIGRTLEINHREFGLAVDRGLAALAPFAPIAPLAVLGVALLATAGIWPRLREYAP